MNAQEKVRTGRRIAKIVQFNNLIKRNMSSVITMLCH
jgi:hypothetical protein